MILVEKHIIKPTNKFYKEIDTLCLLSKNLYNVTLYWIRQYYFKFNKYLSYPKLDKIFNSEKQIDYTSLPAKVSQQTMKMVDQNFKSFFALLKKQDKKVKIPKYLDKNGRYMLVYTIQAASKLELKKGYLKLSKTNIKIKTKVNNIQQVRIIPCNGFYAIEVVYKTKSKEKLDDNKRYCSVDLGINNLMTVGSNCIDQFIINGKPVKSINQYYNKLKAKLSAGTKRIKRASLKRQNKINDYLHKSSRYLINHLVSNNISKLVVGYNKGWKQEINIGKVNNQKFVNIPYYKLLNMLKYKCELEGIELIITEESYTSKCSFLDNEDIRKHETYSGKRIKRGLFKSKDNKIINADVNGALNILRKVVGKYPIEVCSTPLKVTL